MIVRRASAAVAVQASRDTEADVLQHGFIPEICW